jgi:hypothetical protein
VSKSFWIPLIAAFGTMILLYIIGFITNIDFLVFKYSLSYTEISLLPILHGRFFLVASDYVREKRGCFYDLFLGFHSCYFRFK